MYNEKTVLDINSTLYPEDIIFLNKKGLYIPFIIPNIIITKKVVLNTNIILCIQNGLLFVCFEFCFGMIAAEAVFPCNCISSPSVLPLFLHCHKFFCHRTDIPNFFEFETWLLGEWLLLKGNLQVFNLFAAAFAGSHGALHATWSERNLHCITENVLQVRWSIKRK